VQSNNSRAANCIAVDFEILDAYLLDGSPPKAQVVDKVLKDRSDLPAAAAFYRGIEMLGAKTPDLTLIALRLVLAGKRADDEAVVRLRQIVETARSNEAGRAEAVEAYRRELG